MAVAGGGMVMRVVMRVVIAAGLARHSAVITANDPVAILAALGGLEIAVLCGLILGAAKNSLPIVIDGFISTSAAAAASGSACQSSP